MKRRLLTALVLLAAEAVAAPEPVLDAKVETSAGDALQLKTLWKKPTVLFYEDRDSTPLNQHVKEALFEQGRSAGLLDAVAVVAVASVSAYDWFPARNFVLAAVRDVEAKFKLPVYLDFKGTLAQAPWGLPSKNSTVLVLDADGHRVLELRGRLTADELTTLFATLRTMTARSRGD